MVGSALDAQALAREPRYAEFFGREFNVLTPENEFKFDTIHPAQNRYEFGLPDSIVQYAKQHTMAVRGHTLVWGHRIPKWAREGMHSPAALKKILKGHILTVVGHFRKKFPARVKFWDVVNEGLLDDGSINDDILWRKIGNGKEDFISLPFVWAHQADPNALLFYNDYGIEEINPKSDALFKLVKGFLARGIPVHGIGFETHLREDRNYDFTSMRRNFKRFSDLGLRLHITELDYSVNLRDHDLPTEEQLSGQAAVFKMVSDICLANDHCDALVVWGISDKKKYAAPPLWKGFGASNILTSDFKTKPAYAALLESLGGR